MKTLDNKKLLDDFRKNLVAAIERKDNLPTVIAIISREIPSAMDHFEEQSKREAAFMAAASENLKQAAGGMKSVAGDLSTSQALLAEEAAHLRQEVQIASEHLKNEAVAIQGKTNQLRILQQDVSKQWHSEGQTLMRILGKGVLILSLAVLIALASVGGLFYYFHKKTQATIDGMMAPAYYVGLYVQQAKPELWKELISEIKANNAKKVVDETDQDKKK